PGSGCRSGAAERTEPGATRCRCASDETTQLPVVWSPSKIARTRPPYDRREDRDGQVRRLVGGRGADTRCGGVRVRAEPRSRDPQDPTQWQPTARAGAEATRRPTPVS